MGSLGHQENVDKADMIVTIKKKEKKIYICIYIYVRRTFYDVNYIYICIVYVIESAAYGVISTS